MDLRGEETKVMAEVSGGVCRVSSQCFFLSIPAQACTYHGHGLDAFVFLIPRYPRSIAFQQHGSYLVHSLISFSMYNELSVLIAHPDKLQIAEKRQIYMAA
jgi:hypothetical protein